MVTLKVYNGSELLKEVMAWGPSVQVIEPKSLVAQVKTQIDELVELYH
jgi:predicted DNA-binding transcriptional regulator YafY